MKVAYIHAGSDKTGSTALQNYFLNSRVELLKNHSIYYPDPYEGDNHSYFASYFESKPSAYIHGINLGRNDEQCRKSDGMLFNSLKNNISSTKCSKLIISYEGLIWSTEEALHKMKEFLLNYFDSVCLICYARPPVSYAVSAYAQQIYSGIFSSVPAITKWAEILPRFWHVFDRDNVVVRCYSQDKLVHGYIVSDFLQNINPDIALNNLEQNRVNSSMSQEGINLGRSIIRILAERKITLSPIEFANNFGKMLKLLDGSPVRMNKRWIDLIKEFFSPHSQVLNETLGFRIEDFDVQYDTQYKIDESFSVNSDIIATKMVDLYIKSLIYSCQKETDAIFPKKETTSTPAHQCIQLGASKKFQLPFIISNPTPCHWNSENGNPHNIACHWLDEGWNMIQFDAQRFPLPAGGIPPQESREVEIQVSPPENPGRYHLMVTLVQTVDDKSKWLHETGEFTPQIFDHKVEG